MTYTVTRSFFKAPETPHWFFYFGDGLKNSVNSHILDPKDTLYINDHPGHLRDNYQAIWLSGPYRIWNTPSGIILKWDRDYPDDDTLRMIFYFDTEQEARDFYKWYNTNMPFNGPTGSKPSEFKILDPAGNSLSLT